MAIKVGDRLPSGTLSEFFDVEKLSDFNSFMTRNVIMHEDIIILSFDNENIIIMIIDKIIVERENSILKYLHILLTPNPPRFTNNQKSKSISCKINSYHNIDSIKLE